MSAFPIYVRSIRNPTGGLQLSSRHISGIIQSNSTHLTTIWSATALCCLNALVNKRFQDAFTLLLWAVTCATSDGVSILSKSAVHPVKISISINQFKPNSQTASVRFVFSLLHLHTVMIYDHYAHLWLAHYGYKSM